MWDLDAIFGPLRPRAGVLRTDPIPDRSLSTVRDRAAGAYQFSQDETIRAAQMEALKKQREETEAARRDASERTELTAAQESKKRKLDERRALIEAKRQKLLGGKEGVEKKKAEMQDKAASRLLEDVEREMGANAGE